MKNNSHATTLPKTSDREWFRHILGYLDDPHVRRLNIYSVEIPTPRCDAETAGRFLERLRETLPDGGTWMVLCEPPGMERRWRGLATSSLRAEEIARRATQVGAVGAPEITLLAAPGESHDARVNQALADAVDHVLSAVDHGV